MEIRASLVSSYTKAKAAVEKLAAIAAKHKDILAKPDGYSAKDSLMGNLSVVSGEPNGGSYDCVLSKRALSQISERLGAGNFIPELVDWHKDSKRVEEKSVLEELYRVNIEKLKGLNRNPLLFRLNTDPNVVRGILSNQYVVLNNLPLLNALLEKVAGESEKNQVPMDQVSFDFEMSDDTSDMRCYFVNDHTKFDENYRGGIVIKNGECGDCSFEVKLILFNTACHNVFRTNIAYGIRHSAERVFRYSDLVNRMQGELVYQKAGEMTAVLFDRSKMEWYYNQLIKSKEVTIDVDKAQIIMRKTFSQQRIETILEHWKTQEEKTMYGLIQAITYKAQGAKFDVREKEEEFAGKLAFAN